MEDEDTDNWVTYGDAFSDDESEEGRMRALQFGNRRSVPAAYENRVLNEKGRPMRFHGAFTGGFSAGYFNTVGSKEGFKPKAFFSSRKARQPDADETQKESARPEDFMDDEDFGEFGIAPRRIKLAHEFDDTHIRDTLKTSLGGQSVIPGSGSFLKNFIIPSKGPLAERLLRRMGWRQVEGHWEIKEASEQTTTINRLKEDETEAVDCETNDHVTAKMAPSSYPVLRFEAKVNTFGLGYSGLDPDLAMGRRSQRDSNLDQTYAGDRHPEESPAALLQRQQTMQLQSGSGFNPLAGSLHRGGIRGQAFGVGALETDDGDIYVQDRLADYDWEIDGKQADHSEAEEDAEEAELEAARLGRLSSLSTTSSGRRRDSKQGGGGGGGDRVRTLDGWTAPRLSQDNGVTPPRSRLTGTLPGFVVAAVPSTCGSLERDCMPRIPPGYMPVFNPLCVCDPSDNSNNNKTVEDEPRKPLFGRDRKPRHLDALSRCRILEDKESVFDLVTPTDQLRLKAAAAGLPVPATTSLPVPTSCPPSSNPSSISLLPTTGALLKPFKTDPAKQSRFEAFQVLVRRGFADEVAYVRCSGSVELNAEDRDRELSAFQAILSAARLATATSSPVQRAPVGTEGDQEQVSTTTTTATTTPLSTRLAPHKQRLVAGLLARRFRSAGCMDISKEKMEAEQQEELARRATIESLETMEPKDHAVATETYGAMTRRRLTWHPDKLLCKRINVPDPHPESTYVGCPDERRLRNPFTRRGRRRLLDLIGGRGSSNNSKEFSLFDILDVNVGLKDEGDSVEEDAEEEAEEGYPEETESSACLPPTATGVPVSSPALPDKSPARPLSNRRPTGRGAALFACLFDAVEQAGRPETSECKKETDEVNQAQSNDDAASSVLDESTRGPRVLGPILPGPGVGAAASDGEEGAGEDQALPGRPPMDLFKSVFASDEELSDSSVDADEEAQEVEADRAVEPELTEEQSVVVADVPFRHLFQPTGDVAAPLATLSRITSLSSSSTMQPADSTSRSDLAARSSSTADAEASNLLHGPLLPPNFQGTSSADSISALVSVTSGSTGLSSQQKTHGEPEFHWIEASQLDSLPVTEEKKKKKRRHKSKKKKKSHEEKPDRKKRRRGKHKKPRSSSASYSGSEASRSSSDDS